MSDECTFKVDDYDFNVTTKNFELIEEQDEVKLQFDIDYKTEDLERNELTIDQLESIVGDMILNAIQVGIGLTNK